MSVDLPPLTLPVLEDGVWQMTYGERFALEGIVSQVKPALAIEVGTAQGGSLRRIAAHAKEVHCFDAAPEVADVVAEVPNAEAHIGDSAELLPQVLAELAEAGRHVDFALIDGDHTAAGVRRDMQAVLDSPACRQTVVVLHDTANDEVRDGLEAMGLPSHAKVALCMLDAVPGYIVVEDHVRSREIWNGLGLVLLDDASDSGPARVDADHVSVSEVYRAYRASQTEPTPAQPVPSAPVSSRAPLAASAAGLAVGVALGMLAGRR